MRGLQGRLRYAIEMRQAQDPDLSQNEIARRAEIDGGNLSAYCNGQRLSGLQVRTAIKLAETLRVSVNWLLTGAEPSGLADGMTPVPGSAVQRRQ